MLFLNNLIIFAAKQNNNPMKKNLLLLGMLFLSSLCFAQVSKEKAIKIVLDSIVGSDSTIVNVYILLRLPITGCFSLMTSLSICGAILVATLYWEAQIPFKLQGNRCLLLH